MSGSASKQQSPRYFELFTTNNQNLQNKWRLHTSVRKMYDGELKTFIYFLKGKSPIPLMSWPKEKNNVGVHLPVLVFQIHFPTTPSILIDIGVTCFNAMRKRITLSTTLKNKRKTQLSVSFPLSIKQNFTWFHLFIDVRDAIFLSWKNEELKSIDSISIGGMCYLKRVFALRKDFIQNQEGNWFINYDQLPKEMSFSKNIPQTYFCVVCSEEGTDEKDDSESLQPCESDRTFSHSRFADNSWSSLTRSSGASFQLKSKSRKTPHTLLKKQNRNHQPSGNELIMEECDNTVVIREHDALPLPDFSFRERNIPNDLNSIESTLDISPDIFQQNADIVDQDQYEIFSNIEYDSDSELISQPRPEKKNTLHIDLRIERASNMIQNLSCSENSQPERENSNEFDWKKYMLKEYDEIKPNELEQSFDAHEDEALHLRNETDETAFIGININNTNSEGI